MGIQVIDSRKYKYSHEFSIKYALPCLLGVLLLPVWLFPRSVAISTSSPGRFSCFGGSGGGRGRCDLSDFLDPGTPRAESPSIFLDKSGSPSSFRLI